jgi:hypothetical protein
MVNEYKETCNDKTFNLYYSTYKYENNKALLLEKKNTTLYFVVE